MNRHNPQFIAGLEAIASSYNGTPKGKVLVSEKHLIDTNRAVMQLQRQVAYLEDTVAELKKHINKLVCDAGQTDRDLRRHISLHSYEGEVM